MAGWINEWHLFRLQSNMLGYDAYFSSWHVFGREYSRILQMLIAKSLTPIQLTGGGFFVISLNTFSTVSLTINNEENLDTIYFYSVF